MVRRKKSKYSGKTLNDDLRAALGGARGKADSALFFEDKNEHADESERARARRKRIEMEEREAFEKANKDKLESRAEKRMVEQLAKSAGAKTSSNAEQAPEAGSYDLWQDVPLSAKKKAVMDDWTAPLFKSGLTKRARETRSRVSTKNTLAKVKVAHSGASYNPSADAHSKALALAIDAQVAFVSRKSKWSAHPAKDAARQIPMPEQEEDDSGIESGDDSEDNEEEQKEDGAEEPKQPSKRSLARMLQPGDRVTRAQRNKQKRKLAQLAVLRRKEAAKRLKEELSKAPEHVASLEEQEAKAEELKKARIARAEAALHEEPVPVTTKGLKLYRAPLPDVVLTADLSANMRTLKPHGNLALERFDSIHKRNLIEIPEPDAWSRTRKRKAITHVAVGKKFIEEVHVQGTKKKKKRMMRRGRVDISV